MKTKIGGKVFDTTKAEKIATYDSGLPRMDLDYIREGLYRQDGVLFLAGESGARGRYAKNEETGGKIGGEGGYILSLEEVKEWIELTQGTNADTIRTLRERFAARIELDRCNNTQRQPSGNSGGLDMTQSTNSPLAADSKS